MQKCFIGIKNQSIWIEIHKISMMLLIIYDHTVCSIIINCRKNKYISLDMTTHSMNLRMGIAQIRIIRDSKDKKYFRHKIYILHTHTIYSIGPPFLVYMRIPVKWKSFPRDAFATLSRICLHPLTLIWRTIVR